VYFRAFIHVPRVLALAERHAVVHGVVADPVAFGLGADQHVVALPLRRQPAEGEERRAQAARLQDV